MFHINLTGRYFAQQLDESQTISSFGGSAQNVFFVSRGKRRGERHAPELGAFSLTLMPKTERLECAVSCGHCVPH